MSLRILLAALVVPAGGLPVVFADRSWDLPGWARLAALAVLVAGAVLFAWRGRPAGWAFPLVALAAGAALHAALQPREAGNAWARLALPLADIPLAREVGLTLAPEGRVGVWEGDRLCVTASVEGGATAGAPCLLREDEAGTPVAMTPVAGRPGTFACELAAGTAPFTLRAALGRARSRALRVEVLGLPRVHCASVQVQPPDYTGLDPMESGHASSDITCLPGSTLALDLQFDRPLAGLVQVRGDLARPFNGFGDTWLAVTPLEEAGPYRVETSDPGVARQVVLARGTVSFFEDSGPRAFIAGGNAACTAPLGGELDLEVQGEDDIGIHTLTLELQPAAGGDAEVLASWRHDFPPGFTGPVTRQARVTITPARFQAGGEYLLRAVARDFAPGNAPARSAPLRLRVEAGP